MSDNLCLSGIEIVVVICSYGRNELTFQAVRDLGDPAIACRVLVVDNQGTVNLPSSENVEVIRPGSNLGWARGSNLGIRTALSHKTVSAVVLLNNDVRLSRGFVDGLYEAWELTRASVVAPVYDHNWPQQRVEHHGIARDYDPTPVDRMVPFVDGTCMLIPRTTIHSVGLLDEVYWPKWGWGCDKDFCLRARAAGGQVVVTERAYLSHSARGTAALMPGFSELNAQIENDRGMELKWGKDWRELLYNGFEQYPRSGLVQDKLASVKDPGTSAISVDPQGDLAG
jgi:GT2 family glycosyltransferase